MAYDYGGGAYGGTGAGVGASLSPDDELDYHFGLTLEEWARDKPLSILQLDPADRAVLRIAGKNLHHHHLFIFRILFILSSFQHDQSAPLFSICACICVRKEKKDNFPFSPIWYCT